MSTQTKTATDLFEGAYKSYEQALKTGIKVQEDTVKMWKDLLSKTTSPNDLQAKFTEMATCQPGTMAETQNRLRGLWESSLAASRTNVQAVMKANQQILDVWTGLAANGSKKATK